MKEILTAFEVDKALADTRFAQEKGIRFHHFFGIKNGELLATIATYDLKDFQLEEVSKFVANGPTVFRLVSGAEVLVGVAVVHPKDVRLATRHSGRTVALMALTSADESCRTSIDLDLLQSSIIDRSILEVILPGCPKRLQAKNLRPRQEFVPRVRKVKA